MNQYPARLRATTLDDLLLVDVLALGRSVLLVTGSADVVSLAALELQEEGVRLLLELCDGVVIEDVRLAQRVKHRGVATQVVQKFALEPQHILDLESVE